MADVREDDRTFTRYLTRGLPRSQASEVSGALLEALRGDVLLLEDSRAYSDELRLIISLCGGPPRRRAAALAPYLCAFQSADQEAVAPRTTSTGSGTVWDTQLGQMYHEYLTTSCAGYRILTRRVLTRLIRERSCGLRIVDLGCGSGEVLDGSLPANRQGLEVVGVDSAIDVADGFAERFPRGRLYRCRIEEALEDPEFLRSAEGADVVLASMSLHHLTRDLKKTVMAGIYSCLGSEGLLLLNELYGGFEGKPSGSFSLVFSVVKYYALESRLIYEQLTREGRSGSQVSRLLRGFFGREIRGLLTSEGVPGPEECIYAEEWAELLAGEGFRLVPLQTILDSGAEPTAWDDRGDFVVTCAFTDESVPHESIPLLYSLAAKK